MTASYVRVGSIASSASATSITPTLPTNSAGDLFIAIIAIGSTATINKPGAWTTVGTFNLGGSAQNSAVCWRYSTGSDSDPAFTWTGATRAMGQVFLCTGTAVKAFGASAHVSGTTDPHTCTGFGQLTRGFLDIAIDIQNSSTTQTTTPTNFTSLFVNGDATGGFSFAVYSNNNLGQSASLSTTTGAFNWIMRQIEVVTFFPGCFVPPRQYLRR